MQDGDKSPTPYITAEEFSYIENFLPHVIRWHEQYYTDIIKSRRLLEIENGAELKEDEEVPTESLYHSITAAVDDLVENFCKSLIGDTSRFILFVLELLAYYTVEDNSEDFIARVSIENMDDTPKGLTELFEFYQFLLEMKHLYSLADYKVKVEKVENIIELDNLEFLEDIDFDMEDPF